MHSQTIENSMKFSVECAKCELCVIPPPSFSLILFCYHFNYRIYVINSSLNKQKQSSTIWYMNTQCANAHIVLCLFVCSLVRSLNYTLIRNGFLFFFTSCHCKRFPDGYLMCHNFFRSLIATRCYLLFWANRVRGGNVKITWNFATKHTIHIQSILNWVNK